MYLNSKRFVYWFYLRCSNRKMYLAIREADKEAFSNDSAIRIRFSLIFKGILIRKTWMCTICTGIQNSPIVSLVFPAKKSADITNSWKKLSDSNHSNGQHTEQRWRLLSILFFVDCREILITNFSRWITSFIVLYVYHNTS